MKREAGLTRLCLEYMNRNHLMLAAALVVSAACGGPVSGNSVSPAVTSTTSSTNTLQPSGPSGKIALTLAAPSTSVANYAVVIIRHFNTVPQYDQFDGTFLGNTLVQDYMKSFTTAVNFTTSVDVPPADGYTVEVFTAHYDPSVGTWTAIEYGKSDSFAVTSGATVAAPNFTLSRSALVPVVTVPSLLTTDSSQPTFTVSAALGSIHQPTWSMTTTVPGTGWGTLSYGNALGKVVGEVPPSGTVIDYSFVFHTNTADAGVVLTINYPEPLIAETAPTTQLQPPGTVTIPIVPNL